MNLDQKYANETQPHDIKSIVIQFKIILLKAIFQSTHFTNFQQF